jgi:tetratricopeptide (TPR) repeat protein
LDPQAVATREIAEDFRDVLEKLVNARIEGANVVKEHAGDKQLRETLGSAVNAKRQLYKSTANRMLSRASDELTANDYVALGYEYQLDSEFDKAKECYLNALDKPQTSRLERVNVLRSLGALYLTSTVLHDRGKGEGYFRDAVQLTNGLTDDYSRYTTGYTHEVLGMALMSNRYPEWRASIESARESYEAMSPSNILRQFALDSLELRLQQTGYGVPIPPALTPPRAHDAAVVEQSSR